MAMLARHGQTGISQPVSSSSDAARSGSADGDVSRSQGRNIEKEATAAATTGAEAALDALDKEGCNDDAEKLERACFAAHGEILMYLRGVQRAAAWPRTVRETALAHGLMAAMRSRGVKKNFEDVKKAVATASDMLQEAAAPSRLGSGRQQQAAAFWSPAQTPPTRAPRYDLPSDIPAHVQQDIYKCITHATSKKFTFPDGHLAIVMLAPRSAAPDGEARSDGDGDEAGQQEWRMRGPPTPGPCAASGASIPLLLGVVRAVRIKVAAARAPSAGADAPQPPCCC
jgi:hypothetical protein